MCQKSVGILTRTQPVRIAVNRAEYMSLRTICRYYQCGLAFAITLVICIVLYLTLSH